MNDEVRREDIHALIARRRAALDEPDRRLQARRLARWGLLAALAAAGAVAAILCY